jgi:hypothetical protein
LRIVDVDRVEERQHALDQQRRSGGIVSRERRLGEKVFLSPLGSGYDRRFPATRAARR